MPFNRPTLSQLVERIVADIEAGLPGADARLRRSNLNVLARTSAGAHHGLYGYIDWLGRQIPYDTAEAELLARWASIWGVSRAAAAFAAGNVTFTGTDGAAVPLGTQLRSAAGVVYATDAAAVIAAGTATVAATAVEPGAAGNAPAASSLQTVAAIAGVDGAVVVAAGGLTGGIDAESDDALRARLLARIQAPPHGGADFDYVGWAKEVAGVTRAWVFPAHLGLGTVGVAFVRDGDAGSIIPDAGEIAAVQAYIDARRPVTAAVTVFAPVPVAVDFTISLTPDTGATRAAVEAELADLILRESEPGVTLLISHIREAISIAAGETDHVLTAPAGNVAFDPTELPVMGAITWT